MRKRTVTKRRCFCAAKSGRLTLCLLLFGRPAALAALRQRGDGLDVFLGRPAAAGGVRDAIPDPVFPAAAAAAAGRAGRGRPLGLGRAAAKRDRQRSRQPEHHRRQRRRGICGDIAAELFPRRRRAPAAGGLSGRVSDDAADYGDRRPRGRLEGHRDLGGDRRAGAAERRHFLPVPAGRRRAGLVQLLFRQAGCPTPTSACCGCRARSSCWGFPFRWPAPAKSGFCALATIWPVRWACGSDGCGCCV